MKTRSNGKIGEGFKTTLSTIALAFALVLMLIYGAVPSARGDETLPPKFDYLDKVTLTRDQGQTGLCTIMSALHVFDIVKEMEWPYTPDASIRFENYIYQVLVNNPDYPPDQRVFPRIPDEPRQLEVLRDFGGCPETDCPSDFDNSFAYPKPTDDNFKLAKNYTLSSFSAPQDSPTVEDTKSMLHQHGPLFSGHLIPGHFVAIVGYDDYAQNFTLIDSCYDNNIVSRSNGIHEITYDYFRQHTAGSYVVWVNNAPTPLPLIHPYTARICISHPQGRRWLTVKIGVEGEQPVVVWDCNNQYGTNMADSFTKLCIDVPLPDYAVRYWPPNNIRWYLEVTETGAGVAHVESVTFARRWVADDGGKMVDTYSPWPGRYNVPMRGTLRLHCIGTHVLFNFNPNPAVAHGTVYMKGIVLDFKGKPVTGGEPSSIKVSYWSSNTHIWEPCGPPLDKDVFGMFSTYIAVDSLAPDPLGIEFKVEYTPASTDYFGSQTEGILRVATSSVESAISHGDVFFNLLPVFLQSGWPCDLMGTVLDANFKPVSGSRVYISYSTDDGFSWADVYPKLTDEDIHFTDNGIFDLKIRTEATSSWLPNPPSCILIRVDDKPHATVANGTAYLFLFQTRREIVSWLGFQLPSPHVILDHYKLPFEICIISPSGYDAYSFDTASMTINDSIPVQPEWVSFRDYNNDSRLDTVLDINRTVLSNFILSQHITRGNVTLLLTGRFIDNTMFAVEAFIKVRMPGDVNMDGVVNILDLSIAAKAFASRTGEPRWNSEADENEDGTINIMDISIIAHKFGTKYT